MWSYRQSARYPVRAAEKPHQKGYGWTACAAGTQLAGERRRRVEWPVFAEALGAAAVAWRMGKMGQGDSRDEKVETAWAQTRVRSAGVSPPLTGDRVVGQRRVKRRPRHGRRGYPGPIS